MLRLTPKFLAKANGMTKLPSIEMSKNEEKQGVRIQSSVLDMLNLS